MYNPTILSKCLTKDEIIEIPKGIEKYSVHLYLEKGEIEVYYDSLTNTPPLWLYSGAKWNQRFFKSGVAKIIVVGKTQEFKLWVIIERIN